MENKEIRSSHIRRRSSNDRVVEGCAIKFNSDSEDMGFIERINPSAVDEDTIKRSDVFVYLNHDENRGVLARCLNGVGSLDLTLKEDGLYYRFNAPETQLGDELLSNLERGEITTSSFSFLLPKEGGGDRWYRDKDGKLRREILKIDKLCDVSPVYQAAYSATSCIKRKLKEITDIDNKLDRLIGEIETL